MKQIYLAVAAVLISLNAFAQTNSAPNGGFESWTSQICDYPTGYSSSNKETWYRCNQPCNVVKTTDAYSGTYAVQLTTYTGNDTCFAYIASSPNPNGNNPCNWTGGIPFNQTPTGIKGYYKSNVMAGDSAGIIVAFRNSGNCLGTYMAKFGGTHNTYTPFTLAFNPPLSGTPDTLVFAAISSNAFNNIAMNGSMLQLDSISLIGVTQPAALDGNFENWSTETSDKPTGWYNFNSWNGIGLSKTTDKNSGSFAVQLTTYPGDNNGIPRASMAGVATGYYAQNCMGPNCLVGGYPFTTQQDTLCFYYKYAPVNGDTAWVGLNFKNNGSQFNAAGMYIYNVSSSYQLFKFPFNAGGVMDSIIVSFQSSGWNDTTLASVGSTLKIDDVFFRSQGVGIETYSSAEPRNVYPNPNNGTFTVDHIGRHDLVRILNVYGQEVNASVSKENGKAVIHVETPGAYLLFINAMGNISQQRVVVGKE